MLTVDRNQLKEMLFPNKATAASTAFAHTIHLAWDIGSSVYHNYQASLILHSTRQKY